MNNRFDILENSLTRNGFMVKKFQNFLQAKEDILKNINLDNTVGIGGSMTIDNTGIYEDLRDRGNKVYWHWKKDIENAIMYAKDTDVYISSTNAITLDGKLVNMDGNGNRVASMFYGHKDVYILVGKNKICKDYDEASERIKNIAAPLNAKRLNVSTPCVSTGKCMDCSSPQRICKVEVVMHKKPGASNIHIYLVDEEAGY